MSVNPPSPDIPISSGGKIPQPSQRSARSPYLDHVCTVSIAKKAEKAAAVAIAIAGQNMRQASLTTVGNAQHTYDEHPEDKVRGKDSKAVAGALHDIASQHSEARASGGVLRTEVGSAAHQQHVQEEATPQGSLSPHSPTPEHREGSSEGPTEEPLSSSNRQSEDAPVEESQSHTPADVQEAPSDVEEGFVFSREDFGREALDMTSEESASKEQVLEAAPAAVEGIDTSSGIAPSLQESFAELIHEAVHDGKLDASLEKGLQSRMQDAAKKALNIKKECVLGFLDSMAAHDRAEGTLGNVEREILQKGYVLTHEYHGVYRDPDGNVAIFESNGMKMTQGAATKTFLDTLPSARRQLAEKYIASGRVQFISPEELEEHARAGAAIAERFHHEVSSAYQDFKKQLKDKEDKDKRADADAKKAEKDAQLRKPILTQHPHQEEPTLEDASKESQEKTAEKDEGKTGQMLKNVKKSKIQDLRSKDDKDRIKHISDQQEQKDAGQRIDIEEQKKKEEPPHAPPKETNTSSA